MDLSFGQTRGNCVFPDILPAGYFEDIAPEEACPECDGEGLDQCGQYRMVNMRRVWDTCRKCGGSGRARFLAAEHQAPMIDDMEID